MSPRSTLLRTFTRSVVNLIVVTALSLIQLYFAVRKKYLTSRQIVFTDRIRIISDILGESCIETVNFSKNYARKLRKKWLEYFICNYNKFK